MIRVMVVDDQEMIRVGLRSILAAQDGIEVVAEAGDGFEALDLLRRRPVDVVLMDLRMPGVDGVETTRRIRNNYDSDRVKIIILTTFDHDTNVVSALKAGANGFLSKGVGPTDLTAGIRDVVSGGGALSAAAAAALIDHLTAQPGITVDESLTRAFTALTEREREIVVAVARGSSNEQIAAEMHLSPFTVKTHANRAMTKVGAATRAQLVAYAFRAGLVR